MFLYRWWVLACVSSALLLIVIDMTVLYTALPVLTHDLRATASEKLWIVNAYALVVSGLLLGMGTLGDRLGHKRLFLSGLVVFGVASVWAAFSPTPGSLIAARALLAVGAAMMMPATLSIIRLTFTDEAERSMAIGIWAAVASGGAALGPVVGGVLLEYFWWGSVFLINVPIVLLAWLVGWRLIPAGQGDASRHWDALGSIQVLIGLISLAYAVKEMGKAQPDGWMALLTLGISLVFLWLFVRRQRGQQQPMLDFGIFRYRRFSIAVMAALLSAVALVGMELVFTQRLQLVMGLTPLQAGLFLLPLPLASFVAGPLAGYLLPRLGSQQVLLASLLLSAVSMLLFGWLYSASPLVQLMCLVALGLGLGATMTAASATIMQSAPANQAGMVASIEEVSFELGGALGVTLMGSLLGAVYAASLQLPVAADWPERVRDSLDEALLFAEPLSAAVADQLVQSASRAFDQGFVAVLLLAGSLLGMGALVVWRWGTDRQGQPVAEKKVQG